MTRFVRHHSGAVVCTFSVFEADLVRSLASQMVELLRNEQAAPVTSDDPLEAMLDFSGPVDEPDDPVLLRLFPTAYVDDPEAAGEFRRFTESTLRDGKERDAVAVIDTLVEAGLPDEPTDEALVIDVELDEAGTLAWLKAFNDIRLALATRIGITVDDDEDFWDSLPEGDPRSQAYDIYQWLGWLQETLVAALSS